MTGRTNDRCGHADRPHEAHGLCAPCFKRFKRWTNREGIIGPALSAIPRWIALGSACDVEIPVTLDVEAPVVEAPAVEATREKIHRHADFRQLAELSRKPISFEALCDRLGRPPAYVRKLLADAAEAGMGVRTSTSDLQLSPAEQIRSVQETAILPTKSERQMVGVMSDLHCGSKYCLRAQIRDCAEYLYSRGVRHTLIPGDLVDGCYDHGKFELSHVGAEDQAADLQETLPGMPGHTWHAITGNHDCTFTAATGVNMGRLITSHFADHGRKDIRFYGDCGAFVRILGAVVHMWHPLGGCSYAKSYKLQKQIEKYGAGEKPDILLAGHLHQWCAVEDRGVFAVMCPTFQASGSIFSKRLGGQPALGGQILTWEIAGTNLVRNFGVERRRYYELELPQDIE